MDLKAQIIVLHFIAKKYDFVSLKQLDQDMFTNLLCREAYNVIIQNYSLDSEKIISKLFSYFQTFGENLENRTAFVNKLISTNNFKYNELVDKECISLDKESSTYFKNLRILAINQKKMKNKQDYDARMKNNCEA